MNILYQNIDLVEKCLFFMVLKFT